MYNGNERVGVTQGTNYTVTGLQDGQTNIFTVKAKDAAGNASEASTPVQVTAHAPLPNLALNKPATESPKYAAGYEGSMAFDGDSSTRWAVAEGSANPQRVSVDLGETVQIGHVKLDWNNPNGTSYAIQTSMDGTNWTDVYSTTSSDGGLDDITFAATDARSVRLNVLDRSDAYLGVSLNEMEIYGPEATQPPDQINLAKDKTVAVSSTYSDEWGTTLPGPNAVDGDLETRWAAAPFAADSQRVSVNLGTAAQIDRVKLFWEGLPAAITYKIQVSTDGTNWTDVYSSDPGAGDINDIAVTITGTPEAAQVLTGRIVKER